VAELNVPLLLCVRDVILEHPERLNMDFYVVPERPPDRRRPDIFLLDELPPGSIDHCGTTACIAGWAVLLDRRRVPAVSRYSGGDANIHEVAAVLLGLKGTAGIADYATETEIDSVFLVADWPADLRRAYQGAATGRGRARAVARRIERLILEHLAAEEVIR